MPTTSGPKTLLLDIYGEYGRRLGNWFAVADIVTLMASLGLDDQAVRSAVSRMTRRGLLLKERRHGANGYRLSDETLEVMELGDRRIFGAMEPAKLSDGWALVSFSVPEDERGQRYLLRSRLEWLGFGNLSKGLWIAPSRTLDELRDVVRRLGCEEFVDVFVGDYKDFDELRSLVSRSWDLAALHADHATFHAEANPVERAWQRRDPDVHRELAFVDYTLVLHRWRKLPFRDPGLPAELLPADWAGRTAADSFHRLRARLEMAAVHHVETVVGSRLAPARAG